MRPEGDGSIAVTKPQVAHEWHTVKHSMHGCCEHSGVQAVDLGCSNGKRDVGGKALEVRQDHGFFRRPRLIGVNVDRQLDDARICESSKEMLPDGAVAGRTPILANQEAACLRGRITRKKERKRNYCGVSWDEAGHLVFM